VGRCSLDGIVECVEGVWDAQGVPRIAKVSFRGKRRRDAEDVLSNGNARQALEARQGC